MNGQEDGWTFTRNKDGAPLMRLLHYAHRALRLSGTELGDRHISEYFVGVRYMTTAELGESDYAPQFQRTAIGAGLFMFRDGVSYKYQPILATTIIEQPQTRGLLFPQQTGQEIADWALPIILLHAPAS